MKYDALFEPIRIGNLTLKNRFVMAPMAVHMTNNRIYHSRRNRIL